MISIVVKSYRILPDDRILHDDLEESDRILHDDLERVIQTMYFFSAFFHILFLTM